MSVKSINYQDGVLKLLDQTKLPNDVIILDCCTYIEVRNAIRDMIVRGAPAIGVAAAYGVAIGAQAINKDNSDAFLKEFEVVCDVMRNARPTAINLFWAVDRVQKVALSNKHLTVDKLKGIILAEAKKMEREDVETNKAIGVNGSSLIKPGFRILTHCNTGSLATCDYGTALGVIRIAHEQGKKISVLADETRPYLQGSRLTAFELKSLGVDVKVICDNMAGYFMHINKVDCVIVGADRIALNGDTANKIGTYSLAVLAKENNIPFYVAAPISTIDFNMETGKDIPIEERKAEEITHIKGIQITPDGVGVLNPAFDVTPGHYITAIITEKGVINGPFTGNIAALKNK